VPRPASLANFLTFGAVGAIGTVVHYATLVGLVELATIRPTVAAVIGAVAGALVNYWLNYRITFTSTVEHRIALARFACVALLGVAISAVLVATAQAAGVGYLIGQVIATGVVLVIGYFLNRHWTFREHARVDQRGNHNAPS
jgi:putative flippase GtrA